jgi:hypothetical protein
MKAYTKAISILMIAVLAFSVIVMPGAAQKQQPENIESVLYQLVQAQEREDFALNHGLYLKDGKVRVVIELNNDTEAPDFERYGVEIETRYENLVQALVPVDNLINLSEESNINFIRTPLKAHPESEEDDETRLILGFAAVILVLIAVFMLIFFRKRRRE